MKNIKRILALAGVMVSMQGFAEPVAGRWSVEQAQAWQTENGWRVGCNYIPASAINQLEMWQADTFNAGQMDTELALAEELGFNSVRVYLHDLLWAEDSKGFLTRIDTFLGICDSHEIKVMFVFFDGCWDPNPKSGKQRAPTYGVHNPGWVQSPGAELLKAPCKYDAFESYIKGVIGHFKNDKRVLAWDLFNEPDNKSVTSYNESAFTEKDELTRQLLLKAIRWARAIQPDQPLTSAPWKGDWSSDDALTPLIKTQFENSDIISYHCYGAAPEMQQRIDWIKRFNRPLICTEYMSRSSGSTFEAILPILKKEKVGAFNWGFVDGKSQTKFSWTTWGEAATSEPDLWFCEIFRKDGSAYNSAEVDFIKKLIEKN